MGPAGVFSCEAVYHGRRQVQGSQSSATLTALVDHLVHAPVPTPAHDAQTYTKVNMTVTLTFLELFISLFLFTFFFFLLSFLLLSFVNDFNGVRHSIVFDEKFCLLILVNGMNWAFFSFHQNRTAESAYLPPPPQK